MYKYALYSSSGQRWEGAARGVPQTCACMHTLTAAVGTCACACNEALSVCSLSADFLGFSPNTSVRLAGPATLTAEGGTLLAFKRQVRIDTLMNSMMHFTAKRTFASRARAFENQGGGPRGAPQEPAQPTACCTFCIGCQYFLFPKTFKRKCFYKQHK